MPTWQQRRCEYEGCENGGSCTPDGRCRCDLLFHGSRCELDRKVVIIPTICVGSLFVVMIIVLSVLLRRRVRLQQKLTLAEQSYARWEPPNVRRRSTSKYVLALPQRAIDKFRSPKGGVEAQVAARLVTAPGLPHGFFSCFLSHVWASGQVWPRSRTSDGGTPSQPSRPPVAGPGALAQGTAPAIRQEYRCLLRRGQPGGATAVRRRTPTPAHDAVACAL